MDKYVGKRLDGRYEIREILGVGGMAVVYKAYDSIDDRIVAIKILKDELLENQEFRRRFKNESKAIAVLSHPNIVRVYDVSLGDRMQYIVEEYIDGINLKEYIEHKKVIQWKEALHFTTQILRALQHAHDKGIVHRDVKPQNIMLLADGTIKVTDFGIARFSRSEQRTLTDRAIGSVHYISPEQARGEMTDEKSDLYSVGVLLYEMLTGRLPFEADSAVSVAIMQLQNDPPLPRDLNPEIPEGLQEITLRAMQKDPAERYQSAAEMLTDIEDFVKNPTIQFEYKYFVDNEPTKYVTPPAAAGEIAPHKPTPPAEKKSRVMPILLGVTGAFLIGVAVLVLVILGNMGIGPCATSDNAAIECPNLLGLVYNDVINDPQYSKYSIQLSKTEKDYSNVYPAGQIMAQIPDAGKTLKGQYEIVVTVSLGPKKVNLPDYTGYARQTTVDALKTSGISYVEEEVYSDDVASGFVVRTYPAGGTEIDENTVVTVYVSKGSAPNFVTVSNYVGLTEAEAKRAVEGDGLKYGGSVTEASNEYPAGYVIRQSPSAGGTADKSSSVVLYVSTGNPVLPVNIALPVPDNAEKEFTVKVYYNGESVYSKTINPKALSEDTITLPLTASTLGVQGGTASIKVMVEGHPYRDYSLDFASGKYSETKSYTLPAGLLTDSTASSKTSSANSKGA